MKRLLFILAVGAILFSGCEAINWLKHGDGGKAYGAETTEDTSAMTITVKQALLFVPSDNVTKQFTSFETIKTDVSQVANWPKWGKALYDGWSLDVGFAYDDTDVLRDGAIAIGRKLGTLEDYTPLKFPLLKIISITIYPVGAYIENIWKDPKVKFGFGGAYIKAEVKFG